MASYADRSDLEAVLSPRTVAELFKDDRTAVPNEAAIQLILDLSCAQVDASLAAEFSGTLPVLTASIQFLLKAAALEFAIAMSLSRHPEYVKTFGDNKKTSRWARGEAILMQVRTAIKQLPDAPGANRGGIVYADNPVLFAADTETGTYTGDF